MTGEEWNLFLAQLDASDRALAEAIMSRIGRLLNRDRHDMLQTVQRLERRQDHISQRVLDVQESVNRYVAQQDRLEELLQQLAQTLVDVQATLAQSRQAGDGA